MFTFRDKGDRNVTLMPEGTALVRSLFRENWNKNKKKPVRVFYAQRFFRYEKPQLGRYREFTQFGVEVLGPNDYEEECCELLSQCLDNLDIPYTMDRNVVRGLSYYSRNGFEARCPNLGAQQQIAGGGSYQEGCGWAIGIDRCVIAQMNQK